jgi:hypothetical protein
VSRENILRRFDEAGHKKIGTLQFEWQFISSNHTYYIYIFKAMNTMCQLDGLIKQPL